jgi:hypothetical protein
LWRYVRIAILLFVLATVAQTAWLSRTRSTEWKTPLRVAVYPIPADASAATAEYIAGLRKEAFEPLEAFFAREAGNYSVALTPPVDVALAPPIAALPPPAPANANALQAIVWSLKLRYWAWRNDTLKGPKPHVRVFVTFHDPAVTGRVPHSTGLQKGMLGTVNAFASADQHGENGVVLAHEILHTLGATDKYDAATNQPRHPDGYAEPDKQPLHPQRLAEIMAGRMAVSENQAEMPASLKRVVVGPATAKEIGWVK